MMRACGIFGGKKLHAEWSPILASDTKLTIGKYEIVSELGRGGMGVVFKAWEESLQRFVAIKMLGDALTDDENLVARFLREARSVADLNHPNIVQVFAVDTHEGRPYFAMEFVEGQSLSELIRSSQRIEPKRAVTLLGQVASGLSAAHDKGVVHRDIKPDNIMLTRHGGVKVVDFGVARVDDPNTKLTATGMAVGTPNYISPEVCLGLDVDKRSDLFSMGVVLYEMLTGETPFNADSPLEMMTNVVQAEVPDITALNPSIDDGLRMILYHMLEKKPDYRYQDFHQVLEDIEAYTARSPLPHASKATSQPTRKVDTAEVRSAAGSAPPIEADPAGSRVPVITAALVAVLVAAAAGWWYFTSAPEDVPPVSGETGPAIDPVESVADTQATMEESTGDSVASMSPPEETPSSVGTPADASVTNVSAASDSDSGDAAQPTDESESAEIEAPSTTSTSTRPAPAAPVAPDYADPALVVVVSGDRTLAGAVETTLENLLGEAGYRVLNEQFFDGLPSGGNMAALGRAVSENGGDVIILVDARVTGSRTLEFYGRAEEQYIASLQVTAMLPAERRNLGAPWQDTVEYTTLNATQQGSDAAGLIARELAGRLDALKTSN
jgi:serine/threonine-protein kinase